ncbi:AraC family transcriptional regulator [Pseudotabrizicola sediminis]|uniref:AraC family transcriptional regulator n=1 Tax=Pseudotabrizicola sediminis TaxID=2486418 RepID=A0ABY2KR65_9RHOB|nr:AraC family transcriptional regulator [Pseudotabrizicola sediminis]TGD45230.1 AraC family transcriptional regulator [Pseudotabrizicola sediminis]TGD62852.1 AraC family transcriptional regulator [Tabrizicola sp. WMC-M-20]
MNDHPARHALVVPNASTALSQLRVTAIPRLASGGRWRVEAMRAISEPMLLWFTKGQGRITIAGVTRGYTAHNAVFIPPGVMHGFEVGPQVFGTAVFFGRDSGVILPETAQHLRIREVHAQQEINVILDSLQREIDSDIPAHDRATLHYLGLLGVWLERQAVKAAPDTPKPDAARRLVARYTTLLERDFRTGAGVGEFAAALGVTPTHLTRCCRIACGRSAIEVLQDRRIFEARRMLAETRMPVARIGEALGFTSPAYFTRSFQHLTGRSPTAFRREV